MLKVKVKNTEKISYDCALSLLPYCDEYVKEYTTKGCDMETVKNSVLANYLRKQMVEKFFGLNFNAQEITFAENGKPVFKEKEIYFNVSHSKNYIAVAVSDRPVGIDIMEIREFDERVANKYFAGQLDKFGNSHRRNKEFTKAFCVLESKAKLTGKGLFKYGETVAFSKIKQRRKYCIAVSQFINGEGNEKS